MTNIKLETVTISKREYEDLKYAEGVLISLEELGVEDWEWYDTAVEQYNEATSDTISPNIKDDGEGEDDD